MKEHIKKVLWDHQNDAISLASTYINKNDPSKSCLMKLPTGSGKTAIFAVLSRVFHADKNFLILVPSIALKRQVIEELSTNFWIKKEIGIDPTTLPVKEIHGFTPNEFQTIKPKIHKKPFILVCVINTLHELRVTNENDYEYLSKHVDVLVFDEGHKEPAFSWASAARGLKKPLLLFTATPFRNDLKLFNVDKNTFYYLTHAEAIKRRVIRDISFEEFSATTFASKVSEIISIFEKYRKRFEAQGETPKVLIRCEEEDSVRNMVGELQLHKKKVAGIHENFATANNLFSDVPKTADLLNYDFVVHQFKITEGIDFPNFLILVVYEDYSNQRSLIQQIGRVTRNRNLLNLEKALVVCNEKLRYEKIWQSFLAYDENINTYGSLYDIGDVTITNKNIGWIYFNGEFKKLRSKENIVPDNIILPTRVVIKINENALSFEKLKYKVEDEISRFDVIAFSGHNLRNKGFLLLYELYRNSPFLNDELYIERKFGFLVFYLIGQRIYFFSTDPIFPECLNELPNLENDVLLRAFKNTKRFTRINLINSDIGRSAIRANNTTSYKLENSAIGLTDHGQVPTLAEAVISDGTKLNRRYIGIANSKISDYLGEYVGLSNFHGWIKEIDQSFSKSNFNSKYLRRFANPTIPPVDPTAKHILIDVDDESLDIFRFKTKVGNSLREYRILLVGSSTKISANAFVLDLQVNGKIQRFTCQITFNKKTKRYKIQSETLSKQVRSILTRDNFVGFLNKTQPFRIVTEGNARFYAFGKFYTTRLDLLSRNTDLNILEVFNSSMALKGITSEKGGSNLRALNSDWHQNTLFGIISRGALGSDLAQFLDFDHLVCDDLNNENADFIGIKVSTKRITLIHAKAGKSKLSASAFQEVCGQVVKNLDLLSPFYEKAPASNFRKWDGPWTNSKIGTVSKRMRKGGLSASDFWDLYSKLIVDPDTKKDVYIVTGGVLDKGELLAELRKAKIEDVVPEAIQLVYLIRSTWSSVTSVGANLKIFCN